MRPYGRVETEFWSHPGVRRLSDRGRLLYLFLLTGPHTNMSGCFKAPFGYLADDLGWVTETVSEGFAELFREGFAYHDETHRFVFVKDFLKFNKIDNPNISKAMMVWFRDVPDDCPLKGLLAADILEYVKHFQEGAKAEVERFTEPFPERYAQSGNREQGTENREKDIGTSSLFGQPAMPADPVRSTGLVPMPQAAKKPGRRKAKPEPSAAERPLFDEFWAAYPRKVSKEEGLTAYLAAIRGGEPPEAILAGAVAYAVSREGKDPEGTKHASGWLNLKRWNDVIEPANQNQPRPGGRRDWDPLDQAINGIDWDAPTEENAA